jgi:hypothetical protein
MTPTLPGWSLLSRVSALLLVLLGLSAAPAPAAVPAGFTTNLYLPLVVRDPHWYYLVNEDFEGAWPTAGWTVENNNSHYLWGRRDCRAASGHYSAWLMGAGSLGAGAACGSDYQRGMQSWMKFGPFNLHGATAAEFSMRVWINNGQDDTLAQMISTDNSGYSGSGYMNNGQGFFTVNLNLTSYISADQLWVAAYFNGHDPYPFHVAEGAYVDDFVVRYCTDACPDTSASAAPAPAGVPVQMTLPEN